MEQVTQTALTGFRSPAEEEIERISQYVKKELSRQRRIQGFWMFFCGVIAFSMLLPPFLLWNLMETPAIIANLLIGIPTALGAIAEKATSEKSSGSGKYAPVPFRRWTAGFTKPSSEATCPVWPG